MRTPRPAAALIVAALLASGCTYARSSAAAGDPAVAPVTSSAAPGDGESGAPLPTIRLDRPLDVGSFVERDDAAPIDAPVIGVEAEGAEGIDTVVMIGDSITVASTAALEAEFARLGFEEPVIVAQVSKRIAQPVRNNPSGAALAAFLTADDGDRPDGGRAGELWIVALGTNDIGQSDRDELAGAVDAVLAEVPEDAPLVWVDTFYRGEPAGETMVNGVIAERIARRGNAAVAPWSFFAGTDGVLRADGVHPSAAGTEVFAAVVAETAARFLGR